MKASGDLETWAEAQRALARSLGLSDDDWARELERAAARKTGLLAAVVGAAMAEGLGLGVLDQLDGSALAARARALLIPARVRITHPLLARAVDQAATLGVPRGSGASRLRSPRAKSVVPTPPRHVSAEAPSAETATPDAPGESARARPSRRRRDGASRG